VSDGESRHDVVVPRQRARRGSNGGVAAQGEGKGKAQVLHRRVRGRPAAGGDGDGGGGGGGRAVAEGAADDDSDGASGGCDGDGESDDGESDDDADAPFVIRSLEDATPAGWGRVAACPEVSGRAIKGRRIVFQFRIDDEVSWASATVFRWDGRAGRVHNCDIWVDGEPDVRATNLRADLYGADTPAAWFLLAKND
jgi:hypothetical protein